jgi:hypothetical protein
MPTAADHIASAICPIGATKGGVVAFGYDPTPERFPPKWGARSGQLNNELALSFRQPHRIPKRCQIGRRRNSDLGAAKKDGFNRGPPARTA